MKCPNCGLYNPPEALRCDCGYDFSDKSMDVSLLPGRPRFASLAQRKRKGRWYIAFGVFLLVGAIIANVTFYRSANPHILWYGPLVGGLTMVLQGLNLAYSD